MHNKPKQSGLTLTELVVTVAIVTILLGVAVPAARRLMDSLQGGAGTHGLISAALSNARAIAVREQKYAGVWFHRADDNKTYLVLVVNDDRSQTLGGTGLANGFRAVEGRQSIALPDGILTLTNTRIRINNTETSDIVEVFPVIFNSAGRLVTHPVRFRGVLPFNLVDYDSGHSDELGGDIISVNQFWIGDTEEQGLSRTLMISPYTGELVGG